MSLLYMTGFDERVLDRWILPTGSAISFVDGRRADSFALRVINTNSYVRIPIPARNEGYIAAAVRFNELTAGRTFLELGVGATVQIALRTATNNRIELVRGTTVLATSTGPTWAANTYFHLQWYWKIDDVAGQVGLRLNGADILTFSGDTRNVAGLVDTLRLVGINTGQYTDLDDLVVLDTAGGDLNTWPGDLTVGFYLPEATVSAQWVGSDGDSIDNHLMVNDAGVPDMTTRVSAAAGQGRDLYSLPPIADTATSILAVQPTFYMAASDTGTPPNVRPVLKSGAAELLGDSVLPASTTPSLWLGKIETSAPGGVPWTLANFDGLQVGIETV